MSNQSESHVHGSPDRWFDWASAVALFRHLSCIEARIAPGHADGWWQTMGVPLILQIWWQKGIWVTDFVHVVTIYFLFCICEWPNDSYYCFAGRSIKPYNVAVGPLSSSWLTRWRWGSLTWKTRLNRSSHRREERAVARVLYLPLEFLKRSQASSDMNPYLARNEQWWDWLIFARCFDVCADI